MSHCPYVIGMKRRRELVLISQNAISQKCTASFFGKRMTDADIDLREMQ